MTGHQYSWSSGR